MKIISNDTLIEYGYLESTNERWISSIEPTLYGDEVKFTVLMSNGSTIYRYYNIPLEQNNKVLKGFTNSPFSENKLLNIGVEKQFNDYEEVYDVIYPVYEYPVNITTLKIDLYTCSADSIVVNKQPYLRSVVTTGFTFKDICDIINPKIILSNTNDITITELKFDYARIEKFNKYYFVKDIKYLNNNLLEVQLELDVLMTNKNAIYNLTAFVDRNEFRYNERIIDDKLVILADKDYRTTTIETDLFKPQTINSAKVKPYSLYVNGFSLKVVDEL